MSLVGPESKRQLLLAARFAATGLELAIAIVVGYFGGGYLDDWLGTTPYLSYLGLALGIFAGFRNLFSLAKTAQQNTDSNAPPDPPP